MAEFCKQCAPRYGIKIEKLYAGEICEGCGRIGTERSLIDRLITYFRQLFNR